MGQLANWLQSHTVLRPLFDVLEAEIAATLSSIMNNPKNYTQDEMALMSRDLNVLRKTFAGLAMNSPMCDSEKGENVLQKVYHGEHQWVDVLTLCHAGVVKFTECKFGIRPGGARPFGKAGDFRRLVSKKFDDELVLLDNDGECASRLRIVVVEDGHFDGCLSAIRDLENECRDSPGKCSTDGNAHNYALCKCSLLRQVLDASIPMRSVPGELAYFRV